MLFVPEEARQSSARKLILQRLNGAKNYVGRLKKDRKRLRLTLMFGGAGFVAIAAAAFWLMGGRYVSTDNAYVHAAKLMVSTDISGIVSEVDVKEGQHAEVKLETFPYTRYGTVSALVTSVAADAVINENARQAQLNGRDAGASTSSLTNAGASFPATLQLDRREINVDGKHVRLAPGMNVDATIYTK